MRHGTSSRRQRNRGGRRGGNSGGAPNRMQVFDSNGPDVRIRGTAYQVCEKYLALSKDSAAAGDDILAQSYLQHAEHYQRIINEFDAGSPNHQQRQPQGQQASDEDAEQGHDDNLSLPASIIGADSKAGGAEKSQARTAELSSAE